MPRKTKEESFEELAKPLGDFILELRVSCGPYSAATGGEKFQWELRWMILRVVRDPDPETALALGMTALVLNMRPETLDRPDPTIQRYAREFLQEFNRPFAEAILTWHQL